MSVPAIHITLIAPSRQRGVSMVFALLALVVLTLGSVALVRSVDTNVLALGNLAMKQSALAAGSRQADAAMLWLRGQLASGALDADIPAQGYYASSRDTLDPTGRSVGSASVLTLVDWDGNGCRVNGVVPAALDCLQASPPATINGHEVRHVITRMCNTPGNQDVLGSPVVCGVPPIPVEDLGAYMGGGAGYEDAGKTPAQNYNPYYRVITRTVNAKRTVSFTETLAHF